MLYVVLPIFGLKLELICYLNLDLKGPRNLLQGMKDLHFGDLGVDRGRRILDIK